MVKRKELWETVKEKKLKEEDSEGKLETKKG